MLGPSCRCHRGEAVLQLSHTEIHTITYWSHPTTATILPILHYGLRCLFMQKCNQSSSFCYVILLMPRPRAQRIRR